MITVDCPGCGRDIDVEKAPTRRTYLKAEQWCFDCGGSNLSADGPVDWSKFRSAS